MDQIEFPAQAGDGGALPVATGFPTHVKLATLGLLKKMAQVFRVFGGRRKTGWRLEEDEARLQFLRDGERLVPGPTNGRVETEVATMFLVVFVEAQPLEGGTTGTMGDDLPGFHGELEIRRGRGAPAGDG